MKDNILNKVMFMISGNCFLIIILMFVNSYFLSNWPYKGIGSEMKIHFLSGSGLVSLGFFIIVFFGSLYKKYKILFLLLFSSPLLLLSGLSGMRGVLVYFENKLVFSLLQPFYILSFFTGFLFVLMVFLTGFGIYYWRWRSAEMC